MRYLPRFHALRAFEEAIRTGSLSAAARNLNVTPGAVSRQISALEAHIGGSLMRRHHQGITPNERGMRLFQRLSAAFAEIEDAVRESVGESRQEILTLMTFPTFAVQWLMPRLPRFYSQAPHVDLRIRTSVNNARFDREEIDVALMIGNGRWPGLSTAFLFRREFTPVANSDLLRQYGPDPHDALLRTRVLYSTPYLRLWQLWLDQAGMRDVPLDRGICFDNSSLAYQAAREGAGFALGQRALVAEDLRSGRLIAPFDLVLEADRQYHIAWRRQDADRPAIKSFVDWIRSEVESSGNGTIVNVSSADP